MKKSLIIFVTILFVGEVFAQDKDIFIPKEVKKAYKNGTRSYSGKPGENYFQNSADYQIEAEFHPESGLLEGTETITYKNNSPDTLNNLVLRIYMNFFKEGIERDFGIPSQDLHSGIEINNLKIDGQEANSNTKPKLMGQPTTVQRIALSEPVLPDESTTISLDWKVELPTEVAIRMGRYGEDNWFVAYWYPHVSVYDDISGWDTHPFTGSAEFYYDFANFDVKLTLPGDYMVWATGLNQNPEDNYKNSVIEKIDEAKQSDEVISIVSPEDLENNKVLKDSDKKTWHFKAKNVPDFAFATSKSYIWDGTSVEVDSAKGKRTFVDAVYNKNTENFDKVAEISRKTIDLFSDEIFGVPFAYPKLTAFNGSGGMEFPMMINDGDAPSYQETVHLTAHEIGHNYFPFTVMTNESFYAFMDEGLISFLPREVEKELVDDFDPYIGILQGFEKNAGNMKEIPLMVKSYTISDYSAYRMHAYVRPANAFYFLRDMIGEKQFHEAMKEFIQRWMWKKPTPYDFFFTFEDVLDQELSWYWKPWFFELGYPDLALGNVKSENGEHQIEILKKGSLPVPAELTIGYKDGSKEKIRKDASIWKDKDQHQVTISNNKEIKRIQLGNAKIPDIYKDNNSFVSD
ncbi:MAG: M1 family metallopeptidase [Bacteroidota bacterium]